MTEQSGTLSVKLKIARYFILLESVDESRSCIGFQVSLCIYMELVIDMDSGAKPILNMNIIEFFYSFV